MEEDTDRELAAGDPEQTAGGEKYSTRGESAASAEPEEDANETDLDRTAGGEE